MLSEILCQTANLKYLKVQAFAVGMRTALPIDRESTMKGLTALQKQYPYLSETSFDSDKGLFKMRNAPTNLEKEVLLLFDEQRQIRFSWGINVVEFLDVDKIANLYGHFQTGFSIVPVNIDVIDFEIYSLARLPVNFNALLWEAVYSNSPFTKMFNATKILQDKVLLRYHFDNDRVCILSIDTDISDSEVRNQSFKDNCIRVNMGIGQVRGFSSDLSLKEIMRDHLEKVKHFFREHLASSVLAPLDGAISDSVSKGQNK